ncbi:MAG: D-2-hydroxyacid dehydrogenase [Candidatus Dormiibacterota bacterium]
MVAAVESTRHEPASEPRNGLVVMITSPLEAAQVGRVRHVEGVQEVLYEPDLLPPSRYPNDHGGDPLFRRNPVQESRWLQMLSRANALFGYPNEGSTELAQVLSAAPKVIFVQGTSAGMGAHVRRASLPAEVLERVTFASAAGVHGGMLAEFLFFGVLYLRKDAARLARIRSERSWTQYSMGEVQGSTISIVGMGHIGQEVATRARTFGMRVIAVTRTGATLPPADLSLPTAEMARAFRESDTAVVTLPLTTLTQGLVSREILAELRPSAIFGNLGRGAVADQGALVEMLQANQLAGAVLDVFDPEPLPADNPLWTLANVVMAPHTAALSTRENERIVSLFCDNLRRLAKGQQLVGTLNLVEFY